MKLVVLSEPEWSKYQFIVHRHLNAALEFAQAIDETLTLGWLEGYETGAVTHTRDWYFRRHGTGGYEDVDEAVVYPNTRWMYEDTPNLVLAFEGPDKITEAGESSLTSNTFQQGQHLMWNGAWVKWIPLPVAIPKEPKDAPGAPSAMDVLHGKLAA